MQADMQKAQEELANERVEATAGGGMVTVTASGSGEIVGIKIAPEAVDPDDVEMLEDLILAAVNEARARRRSCSSERIGGAHRRPRAGPAGHVRHIRRRADARSSTTSSRSSRACPASGRAPRSGSPSTSCACPPEEALALADAIREVKERIGFCVECFNLAEERALPRLPRRAARPLADLRRRGAGRHRSRSSARTSTAASTTCSAARSRRSTASSPSTCASPSCSRASTRNGVEEVVLATNPTMTGEATAGVRRRPPARARARDAARERAARRRRPRVRRRGHARPRALRPPRACSAAQAGRTIGA